jgi:hypothetical protein
MSLIRTPLIKPIHHTSVHQPRALQRTVRFNCGKKEIKMFIDRIVRRRALVCFERWFGE